MWRCRLSSAIYSDAVDKKKSFNFSVIDLHTIFLVIFSSDTDWYKFHEWPFTADYEKCKILIGCLLAVNLVHLNGNNFCSRAQHLTLAAWREV